MTISSHTLQLHGGPIAYGVSVLQHVVHDVPRTSQLFSEELGMLLQSLGKSLKQLR